MAKVNGIRTLQPVMFVGEEKEAEAIREGNRKKWQALHEFYHGASPEELAEHMGPNSPIDFNCIILYLKRRVLTAEEKEELKKVRQERADFWTLDRVLENFKDQIDAAPPQHRQDVIDLLMMRRGAFLGQSSHLRVGTTTFCLDAIYPKELPAQ